MCIVPTQELVDFSSAKVRSLFLLGTVKLSVKYLAKLSFAPGCCLYALILHDPRCQTIGGSGRKCTKCTKNEEIKKKRNKNCAT